LTVIDTSNPNGAIGVMNSNDPTGSSLHAVVTSGTLGPNGYESPDWSPTGSRLVFVQTKPLHILETMNADGSGLPTQLPCPVACSSLNDLQDPVWSPDGSFLLADQGSGSLPLILMNFDGSGQTMLTFGGLHPSWQPVVAPLFTSAPQATFIVRQFGLFTVTAIGMPAPTLSESGALPSGVTFNSSTGVLSGTPGSKAIGTYPLTFTASNMKLPDAVQSFTLTVAPKPRKH
jgi:hypothetical protein